MTPPPNSTADNIDEINTDYHADPRAINMSHLPVDLVMAHLISHQ